jgi:PTS system galactitol-specific IIA component
MTTASVSPVLPEALVLLDLAADDAAAAMRTLATQLYRQGFVKASYIEAVLQREAVYPTGFPTVIPVALPHTDVEHCLRPALAIARLTQPVSFGMIGDPTQTVETRLIFMLSVTDPAAQVRWLRRLVDCFQQPELLGRVLEAASAAEVVALLQPHLQERDEKASPAAATGAPALELIVAHPVGLHARPAAKFIQTAARFPCAIRVANVSTGSRFVDAKSILGVLSLGVSQGHRIRIEAEGEAAAAALEALQRLIESNFGEGG